MRYNPRLKKLVISPSDLDQAYFLIMYALKSMRQSAKLPLEKHEKSRRLTAHDSAAMAIIEVGMNIGIDFEVTPQNHNKLDLTEIDN